MDKRIILHGNRETPRKQNEIGRRPTPQHTHQLCYSSLLVNNSKNLYPMANNMKLGISLKLNDIITRLIEYFHNNKMKRKGNHNEHVLEKNHKTKGKKESWWKISDYKVIDEKEKKNAESMLVPNYKIIVNRIGNQDC